VSPGTCRSSEEIQATRCGEGSGNGRHTAASVTTNALVAAAIARVIETIAKSGSPGLAAHIRAAPRTS